MRIHINGVEQLTKKLAAMSGDNAQAEIRRATDKAVKYVHSQVPAYPPQPPLSRYRRTGTLGRSIGTDVRTLGNSVVGLIGTAVVYAPYVISQGQLKDGRGPQAKVHQGRWWTLQGVVLAARDGVVNIYQEMVKDLLKR